MTTFTRNSALLEGLSARVSTLCNVSKKLIVHEFLAAEYGVTDVGKRQEELENRTVDEIAAAIDQLDSPNHRPLAKARPPKKRLIGNCRQFSVLTCALLRRAGVPARARCGFSAYLDPGQWTDHWIVERWDTNQKRWMRTDAQLDEKFHELLGYEFDPLDLPEGEFLSGSEAWQRCRAGAEDPELFGLDDMRGPWFVAGDAIRDLAALNKVELLPWDVWGAMPGPEDKIDPERAAFIDDVAQVVVAGQLDKQQELYRQEGLKVPQEVFSARFERPVRLPVPVD
jgi:hypothetical protein